MCGCVKAGNPHVHLTTEIRKLAVVKFSGFDLIDQREK